MDDLVKRLLAGTGGGQHWMDLHEEAADEITRLRAKLEECLKCNEEFSALEKVHKKQIAALEARIAKADALADALDAMPVHKWSDMWSTTVPNALAAYRKADT